jgi:hypothetical protein
MLLNWQYFRYPNLPLIFKGIEILFNQVNCWEDFKGLIDYTFYIMLYVGVCFIIQFMLLSITPLSFIFLCMSLFLIQMENLNIHETVRSNSINVNSKILSPTFLIVVLLVNCSSTIHPFQCTAGQVS